MRPFQSSLSRFGPLSAPVREQMATQPQSRGIDAPAAKLHIAGGGEQVPETALIQSPQLLIEVPEAQKTDSAVLRIPIELDVAVPIRRFRVRNLLALDRGQVIESGWLDGDDMPLGARGAQLAWTEFEVIDRKLAVRITRLA